MPVVLVVLGVFSLLSLLALGGGTAALPQLQAEVVDKYGWVTDRQFVELYAISNITPGPTMLFVCVVGWRAAGWAGAVAAFFGMFGPSSLLTLYVRGVWDRFEKSPWRHAVEKGLAPVGVGLLLSGSLILARASCSSSVTIGIAAVSTILCTFTRINLLWIMAAAAVVGLCTT